MVRDKYAKKNHIICFSIRWVLISSFALCTQFSWFWSSYLILGSTSSTAEYRNIIKAERDARMDKVSKLKLFINRNLGILKGGNVRVKNDGTIAADDDSDAETIEVDDEGNLMTVPTALRYDDSDLKEWITDMDMSRGTTPVVPSDDEIEREFKITLTCSNELGLWSKYIVTVRLMLNQSRWFWQWKKYSTRWGAFSLRNSTASKQASQKKRNMKREKKEKEKQNEEEEEGRGEEKNDVEEKEEESPSVVYRGGEMLWGPLK